METRVVDGKTYVKNGPITVGTPADDESRVSSPYGPRTPFTVVKPDGTTYTTSSFHGGVDLVAPYGAGLYALGDGVVHRVDLIDDSAMGYWMQVKYDDGAYGTYLHMQRAMVPAGTRVRKGTWLGSIGLSGLTNGPHLHFELWLPGIGRVDPIGEEALEWAEAQDEAEKGMSPIDRAIFEARGYKVEEHFSGGQYWWLVVRA